MPSAQTGSRGLPCPGKMSAPGNLKCSAHISLTSMSVMSTKLMFFEMNLFQKSFSSTHWPGSFSDVLTSRREVRPAGTLSAGAARASGQLAAKMARAALTCMMKMVQHSDFGGLSREALREASLLATGKTAQSYTAPSLSSQQPLSVSLVLVETNLFVPELPPWALGTRSDVMVPFSAETTT